MVTSNYYMTLESISDFISDKEIGGASKHLIRGLKRATRSLYDFLPEDKVLTKELLLEWRKGLEEKGYAPTTILGYVKYINLYLIHAGFSDIRFNRGKATDITGITRGYLTAIEPTDKRDRKDVIWRFECRCGNTIELAATRFLSGNTLSCGCLRQGRLNRANKNIANTNLRQALDDQIISTRSASGYVGVSAKRGKWQAYITYKSKRYYLGTFSDIEDAVKARLTAKELVVEDAEKLLAVYEDMHSDDYIPTRDSLEKFVPVQKAPAIVDRHPVALRQVNNTSGCTGVFFRKGRWEAYISYKGVRYRLGRHDLFEDAVSARKTAEALLRESPDEFVRKYSKSSNK